MPSDVLLIVVGAFLAAFTVGAAGFGDALIAAAVWLHAMDPRAAVPLIVASGLVIHTTTLFLLRDVIDFSRFWPFLVGGTLGTPVGVWLLDMADPAAFRFAMGVFLTVYGAFFLILRSVPVVSVGGRTLDGTVGGIGGVLGGLAGLSGFLPALWCGQRGWPPRQQRGVTQPFILCMHAMALAWLFVAGVPTRETAKAFAWCLPAVAAGVWVGVKFYGRLDARLFRRIVLVTLMIAGVLLLISRGGSGS